MNTKGDLLPRQSRSPQCSPSLWAPVVVSPAHVHLTAAMIETLFCDRYRLHERFRLGQPALYQAQETVSLVGPAGRLDDVPVMGPPRAENQIEVSAADALTLGIAAPVRRSGHIAGTPGVVIQGPRTSARLESGLIRALRHVHMSPADAEGAGVHDGDRIDVAIRDHHPQMILPDVLVRVSPESRLGLHLDMDEAHEFGLQSGDRVELCRRNTAR